MEIVNIAEAVGYRPTGRCIDAPCELGYMCPVCKIERDEDLQRSEYNYHLRCPRCEKDYPSCLCFRTEDIKSACAVFLEGMEKMKKGI